MQPIEAEVAAMWADYVASTGASVRTPRDSIGKPIDDATPVVLERFAKVWPPPVDPPSV